MMQRMGAAGEGVAGHINILLDYSEKGGWDLRVGERRKEGTDEYEGSREPMGNGQENDARK